MQNNTHLDKENKKIFRNIFRYTYLLVMLNDLVFKNMETCVYQIRKNKFTLKNIFSRYKLIKKYVTKFTSTNFFHFLTIIKKIISKYKRTNLTFSQNDYNKIIHIKHKWVQRIHIINFSIKNLMYYYVHTHM